METICLGMGKEVKNVSTILSRFLDYAFSSTFGRYSTSGYLHVRQLKAFTSASVCLGVKAVLLDSKTCAFNFFPDI